jgi:hypothetical protein
VSGPVLGCCLREGCVDAYALMHAWPLAPHVYNVSCMCVVDGVCVWLTMCMCVCFCRWRVAAEEAQARLTALADERGLGEGSCSGLTS